MHGMCYSVHITGHKNYNNTYAQYVCTYVHIRMYLLWRNAGGCLIQTNERMSELLYQTTKCGVH